MLKCELPCKTAEWSWLQRPQTKPTFSCCRNFVQNSSAGEEKEIPCQSTHMCKARAQTTPSWEGGSMIHLTFCMTLWDTNTRSQGLWPAACVDKRWSSSRRLTPADQAHLLWSSAVWPYASPLRPSSVLSLHFPFLEMGWVRTQNANIMMTT